MVLASTVWLPLAHWMVPSALGIPVVTSLTPYTKSRWMLHYQVRAIAVPEGTAEPVNFGITENTGIFPSYFLHSYILTLRAKAHLHIFTFGA